VISTIVLALATPIVDRSTIAKIATALNVQIARDFAPAWGRVAPVVVVSKDDTLSTITREALRGVFDALPQDFAVVFVVDGVDVPNVLGVHDVGPGGRPFGYVDAGALARDGSLATLAAVLSHETLELLVDPYCVTWTDAPADAKERLGERERAFEVCDPTQADSYPIGDVMVSNFLYPAYFCQSTLPGTRLDHMRLVREPFQIRPGGYALTRSTSGVSNVFGSAPQRQTRLRRRR
jgi:hypothetical protein